MPDPTLDPIRLHECGRFHRPSEACPTFDRLASLLGMADFDYMTARGRNLNYEQQADVIRAALADGTLTPEDLGMVPIPSCTCDGRNYNTPTGHVTDCEFEQYRRSPRVPWLLPKEAHDA